ncbi:Uncharacterised protein [Legionella adelaidensis]|uniref:Uncharacterized protein n=1 Tax=Legionella adelaidensis TaxID=45056 RepID=A0A0W0R6B4_9GAMM|nr:hypothetical protein [Legionella adelaidensis]KTC66630.1 hypothetical protein Lade_1288 [Legionella adelaidensis]VEH81034.1 Uncharacterised protein [Legionella adelaidensis]
MPSLLQVLYQHQPLGFEDTFEGLTTSEALHKLFFQLHEKMPQSPPFAAKPQFSCDTYISGVDPSVWEQKDEFAAQISQKIPNAVICHMRLYQTDRAHWHALCAFLDEKGELKQIIITDSRTQQGKGVTAQLDIDNNPFLRIHANKISFIPGIQQPIGTVTCWFHCLANLVSLANTGTVYVRKQPFGSLSTELLRVLNVTTLAVDPSLSSSLFKPHKKPFNESEGQNSYCMRMVQLGCGMLLATALVVPAIAVTHKIAIALLIAGIFTGILMLCAALFSKNSKEPTDRVISTPVI